MMFHVSGTGKTLIGVKIAYWFVELNRAINSEEKQQILFCGPSNSAVDVAASKEISLCFL